MSNYGHMVNDIREIFKAVSPEQFFDRLLDHMNEVSKKYDGYLLHQKDHQNAMNCFFVGYLTTSLMLSAMENSGVSAEKQLFYIGTVIQVIEEQLLRGTDETRKEAN